MQKAPYFLLLAFQLFSIAAFLFGILSLEHFYYSGLLSLTALIWFAYRGLFPFNATGQIASRLSWYGSCVLSLLGLALLGNSGEALFWFPTDHSFWLLVPFLFLGAIFLTFALAKRPTDRAK
jgi:hypothetical protein